MEEPRTHTRFYPVSRQCHVQDIQTLAIIHRLFAAQFLAAAPLVTMAQRGNPAGRLAGWLAGWQDGWLVGWRLAASRAVCNPRLQVIRHRFGSLRSPVVSIHHRFGSLRSPRGPRKKTMGMIHRPRTPPPPTSTFPATLSSPFSPLPTH